METNLPEYTAKNKPAILYTRNRWLRQHRKVRKGEKPVALLTWTNKVKKETDKFDTDGTQTIIMEDDIERGKAGLFHHSQTTEYHPTRRTVALWLFIDLFLQEANRETYIWWKDGGWKTCWGILRDAYAKSHVNGTQRYGILAGERSYFRAIDLDLHNGDPEVFLAQLKVLLEEFHGKRGWHFQVADQDANGIHLIQVRPKRFQVSPSRLYLRSRLRELDKRHPELAKRAVEAGMKTVGQLELYPDPKQGFRLPLCEGRTMLLDRPLPLTYHKQLKRHVQDVIGYVQWIQHPDKEYMAAEEVIEFVKERLRTDSSPRKKRKGKAPKQRPITPSSESNNSSPLGTMKGRFTPFLINFWTGKHNPPDSLNQAIRLLAVVLPFYLEDSKDAVDLIEQYVDELPDISFSDRLSDGNRQVVSDVIRQTVKQAYDNLGGQPFPEVSKKKLQGVINYWKQSGFDPTNKSTWGNTKTTTSSVHAELSWSDDDASKLQQLKKILKVDFQTTASATKQIILQIYRKGAMAINLAKLILEKHGVKCGHHGKVNKFMKLLRAFDWIALKEQAVWHPIDEGGKRQKGKSKVYAVGAALLDRIEVTSSP